MSRRHDRRAASPSRGVTLARRHPRAARPSTRGSIFGMRNGRIPHGTRSFVAGSAAVRFLIASRGSFYSS
jgi:hypothetical protein